MFLWGPWSPSPLKAPSRCWCRSPYSCWNERAAACLEDWEGQGNLRNFHQSWEAVNLTCASLVCVTHCGDCRTQESKRNGCASARLNLSKQLAYNPIIGTGLGSIKRTDFVHLPLYTPHTISWYQWMVWQIQMTFYLCLVLQINWIDLLELTNFFYQLKRT